MAMAKSTPLTVRALKALPVLLARMVLPVLSVRWDPLVKMVPKVLLARLVPLVPTALAVGTQMAMGSPTKPKM